MAIWKETATWTEEGEREEEQAAAVCLGQADKVWCIVVIKCTSILKLKGGSSSSGKNAPTK